MNLGLTAIRSAVSSAKGLRMHLFHSKAVAYKERLAAGHDEHSLPLRFPKRKLSHYEMLGVSTSASHRDIKRKFKQLSKLYHPDIVNSNPKFQTLSEEDKTLNSENYIKLVQSYETLSDPKKRLSYDLLLNRGSGSGSGTVPAGVRTSDVKSKYYGEAKYYSRSGSSQHYSPSGLNFSRNRVHYGAQYDSSAKSMFHGMPNNNAKDDVPHFDYDKHLELQMKMEERLLHKRIKQYGQMFSLKETGDILNADRRFHNIYRHSQKKKKNQKE